MQKKTFYVTTPIYYPSGKLHIGHTYTTVAADAIARYKRFAGYDVHFLTGTDEHGEKIQQKAKEAGLEPIVYLDGIIQDIKKLWARMEISYDDFIRTTEQRHEWQVQKIFDKLYEQGDIYLGKYEGHYCVQCEAFWTESQLDEGSCPDCHRPVEKREEESYFFRLSKYQEPLIQFYQDHPAFCSPESRKNEMLNNFLLKGLEDLSVSRTTFNWGIPVSFDPKHVIYVWIDALCNYITALGYWNEEENYKKYWPADVHLMAKEIVRFHSIIWPALLMALDVPLPKMVYGHGWILFSEDKMSKSKGNVIYPEPIIERYGVDALKYFLLREFIFGPDANYTNRIFLQRINSDLSNDLGNLLSRSVAMIEKYAQGEIPEAREATVFDEELRQLAEEMPGKVDRAMDRLQFSEAFEEIWKVVRRTNKYIDETAPWNLAKEEKDAGKLHTVLYHLAEALRIIGVMISPLLHKTAEKMFAQLGTPTQLRSLDSVKAFGATVPGTKVEKGEMLFPRLDVEKELAILEEIFGGKEDPSETLKKESAPLEVLPEKAQEESPEPELLHKEEIGIEEFQKMELRVAKVLSCEKHPKADRLLVFQLQVGGEKRQIVSGIAKFYKPEELVGKNVVIIANLKPVKLRGLISQGMILSAARADDSHLVVVEADGIEDGVEVL